MKYLFTYLALLLVPQVASAQCYQNGIPCTSTPSEGNTQVPASGTIIMGVDHDNGDNKVPIMTDANGRLVVSVTSTPSIPTGTNIIGGISNSTFGSSQSGVWNINNVNKIVNPVATEQSGNWSVGLNGLLPAFAAPPTVNLGTINNVATDASVQAINTTLGNPFQTGGLIGNTVFGATQNGPWTVGVNGPVQVTGSFYQATQPVSQSGSWKTELLGSLPGFATTPTVNLGTIGSVATDASVQAVTQALGTPFQVGGSIANSSFGASQQGSWSVGLTGPLPSFATPQTVNLGTISGVSTAAKQDALITALGSPLQTGGSIGNTSFGSSQVGPWSVGLNAGSNTIGSIANTAFGITGTLPAFANTPTVNIGSAPALAVYDSGFVTSALPSYPSGNYRNLSLTTNGLLRVDGSNVTQPVSFNAGSSVTANIGTTNGLALDTSVNGLFKAGQSIGNTAFGATQSGTWNVGLNAGTNAIGSITNSTFGATQSGSWSVGVTGPVSVTGDFYPAVQPVTVNGTVPVSGTFYQATQPVSATALPLPNGAATSALQNTMNTNLNTIVTNTTGGATAANQMTMNANLSTLVTNTTGAATAAKQDTSNNYLATIAANAGQVSSAPATWTNTGTISALNGTFDLVSPGSGSALLSVTTSNFVGTLSVYGCIDTSCTILGNRLLFRSGVGSTGSNMITLTGSSVTREYRIVGGGNRFRVVATSYTSGTVSLTGFAQSSNNILFVNGPVHTAEEEALRQARGYTASTGVVAVATNNYLNTKLCNPANSGINMFITVRKYNSNITGGNTPLEFQTYANPTTVPTSNGTISNRWVGGGPSAATFQYQMATSMLSGGTLGTSGFIATNGQGDTIVTQIVLTPGQCTGVSIGGGGGGLAAAARVSASFVWYEEPIN